MLMLIVPIVVIGLLSGCSSKNEKITSTELDSRFMVIDDTNSGLSGYNRIIVDRDTGVMYLFHGSKNRGGLTIMVGEDGKPLLYDKH